MKSKLENSICSVLEDKIVDVELWEMEIIQREFNEQEDEVYCVYVDVDEVMVRIGLD